MRRPSLPRLALDGDHAQNVLLRALFAVGLWLVLAAAALTLSPMQVAGAVAAVFVGLGLLFRPMEAIVALLGLRVVFDLMWDVSALGLGLNVMQLFSAGATVGAAALFLMNFERIQRNRAMSWFLVLAGLLLIAGLRQVGMVALQSLAKLASPMLMMFLAAHLFASRQRLHLIPGVIALVGVVPIAYSLYSLATGQNIQLYAGTDRLVGGYENPTHHALTMAVLASIGVYGAYRLRRRWWAVPVALYTAGALVALYYSYTRAAQIAFALFLIVFLYRERRYRWLGVAVAMGAFVFASSEILQQRFVSLHTDLTADVPLEDPTQQLGSGRWQLWTVSMAFFLARPAYDWLLGMGLGMEVAHPMGMNPHNDYLSLLYQAGPLAVVAFVALNVVALRAALTAAREARDAQMRALANFVFALGASALITNAITNGFLVRTSPAWYLFSILGMGFAALEIVRREGAEGGQA